MAPAAIPDTTPIPDRLHVDRSRIDEKWKCDLLPQSVGFLDLPFEIREMIYKEAAAASEGRIRISQPNHIEYLRVRRRGFFDCFSLLHTCGQIRQEFLKHYWSQAHYAVKLQDTKQFLDLLDRPDPAIQPKQLTILLAERTKWNPGFEIRPYLRLLFTRLQGVEVTAACQDSHPTGFLMEFGRRTTQVLRVLSTGAPAWKDRIIKGKIVEVLVRPAEFAGGLVHVRIIYASRYTEWWMGSELGNQQSILRHNQEMGLVAASGPITSSSMQISVGVRY